MVTQLTPRLPNPLGHPDPATFAESLSCHLSRLFSSSSHVSIAAPILAFIIRPHPASMGWILSVWFLGSKLTVALIRFLHVSWNVWLCWKQNRTLSSFSFPIPGISVPWTHCMLMSSSIQAVYWKYIWTLLLYFSFSSVATHPFSLKIRGGFTFCSPSALVQSCRVACCLSKPGDGCSTLTGLAPNVL